MESKEKSGNKEEDGTEAGIGNVHDPGVEFLKGLGTLGPHQLPSLHNTVQGATPIFKSYQSVFQGWKNSVPKLYKYPSSEIEVVVYRKNGLVHRYKTNKKRNLEGETSSESSSVDDQTNETSEQSKLVTRIQDGTYLGGLEASYETSSLPLQLNSNKDFETLVTSENESQSMNVTGSVPLSQTYRYNTCENKWNDASMHASKAVGEVVESFISKDMLNHSAAENVFKSSCYTGEMNFCGVQANNDAAFQKENCHFMFGLRLSPFQLKSTCNMANQQDTSSDFLTCNKDLNENWKQGSESSTVSIDAAALENELELKTEKSVQSDMTSSFATLKCYSLTENRTLSRKEIAVQYDSCVGTPLTDVFTQTEDKQTMMKEITVQHDSSISPFGTEVSTQTEDKQTMMKEIAVQHDSCIGPFGTETSTQTEPKITVHTGVQNDSLIHQFGIEHYTQTEAKRTTDAATQNDSSIHQFGIGNYTQTEVKMTAETSTQNDSSIYQFGTENSTQTVVKRTMETGVQNYPQINNCSTQTESAKQVTSDKAVQILLSAPVRLKAVQTENASMVDRSVQNVPLSCTLSMQTEEEIKYMEDAECQSPGILVDVKHIQTEAIPQKLTTEFGCQNAPSLFTQGNQTGSNLIEVANSTSQTTVQRSSEQTQTSIVGVHVDCQAVAPVSSKHSQTNEYKPSVKNNCCQATTTVNSKSSQVESSILRQKFMKNVAIQKSITYDSKETQLSGSCCNIREQRIRKEYEMKLRAVASQKNASMNKEIKNCTNIEIQPVTKTSGAEGGCEADSGEKLENKYTEEEIRNLITRFNGCMKETEEYHNVLEQQVTQMTQLSYQVILSATRNLDDDRPESEYFEDDFVPDS